VMSPIPCSIVIEPVLFTKHPFVVIVAEIILRDLAD
jgi:hypothetical protein